MFLPIYEKIEKEVSGIVALNHVAEIARHHRIQASPGIRDACNYAIDALNGYGIEAKLHSYPANDETYDWTSLRFQEWSCNDAWLKLVESIREARYLARYSEEKIHVIQRSISTAPEGIIAEVAVPKNHGEELEDYKGLDIKGKMVVVDGGQQRVHELAVEKLGALGLIYDGMFVSPPVLLEGELDDALKYTSYWWSPEDIPSFGFVVTPRTGRWLRTLVNESETPVKVHCYVDAELYDGHLDNAVATISGETDEEVIIIAHICHPQPCANDNASGCGAAMEAARVLNKLIKEGELPKPKRTIRLTLVPEMAGSYAYLAEREEDIPKMVAAINLDMVGEDQDQTGSVNIVHRTPDSLPSYVNAVIEAIFAETQKEMGSLGGSTRTASFRHAVGSFSGGSDHYIYSDPSVGIGCPFIAQWPDKFYHTSADSIEKVSPTSLKRAALITATYSYFIANADEKEVVWIASQIVSHEKRDLQSKVQERIDRAMRTEDPEKLAVAMVKVEEKARFDLDVGKKALKSLLRISPKSEEIVGTFCLELEKFTEAEVNNASTAIREYAEVLGFNIPVYKPESSERSEGALKVPVKLHRGPYSTRPWIKKLSQGDQEALRKLNKRHGIRYGGPSTQALYWTDGHRNLAEISRLLELETGETNLQYLIEYYRFMEKMGRIKLT